MGDNHEWTKEELQDMQIYSLKSALKDACKLIHNPDAIAIFTEISNRRLEDYRT